MVKEEGTIGENNLLLCKEGQRGTYAQGVQEGKSQSGVPRLKVQGCDTFCGAVLSFTEALPKCVSSRFARF